MIVGSASCFGGRLHLSRLPQRFALHSHARLLSSHSLQRPRPLSLRQDFYTLPRSSISLWPFSKSSASTPAPPPPVVETLAPEVTAAVVEQPPAETTTLVESANSADLATPLSDVTEAATDVLSNIPVSSIPSPLHYGDLAAMGLAAWTPAGICRWGIEAIQVSTGMPWFWTIITATVLSRVFLFPFTVKSMKNTAALAPHQEALAELREDIMSAQKSGDPLAMQKAILKQKMVYEKIGVSMPAMAVIPFIQLPVTLGMFFGVKKLCDLPLEQLKYSGVDILPNLTVADPTFILPVISAVMMNAQLSLGLRDMTAAPHLPHMINAFRLLSLASVFFMANLPSGVMVYLIASISSMIVQTLILRIPAVRRKLGIPVVPKDKEIKSASFKESYEYAKKWWKDKKQEQETIIRSRKR